MVQESLADEVCVYSSVGKICSLLPFCEKISLFLIIGIDPFTEHASISFAIVVACTYIKIFH